MKKGHFIFSLVLVLILVASFGLILPKKSMAIAGFGGRITVAPVICTNGIMITIGAPRPGNYLITPASKKYLYSMFKSGSWVLGTFTTGGQCLIPPSAPIPVIGTVLMIGTSR